MSCFSGRVTLYHREGTVQLEQYYKKGSGGYVVRARKKKSCLTWQRNLVDDTKRAYNEGRLVDPVKNAARLTGSVFTTEPKPPIEQSKKAAELLQRFENSS